MNRITQYLRLDDLLPVDDLDGSDMGVEHNDAIVGQWMSVEPLGYKADDVNVTPYVDRPPQ